MPPHELAQFFQLNQTQPNQTQSNKSHWGLLGTVLWGALIMLIMIVVQIASIGIFVSINHTKFNASSIKLAAMDGNYLAIATIATAIVCCSIILLAINLKSGAKIKEYLCLHRFNVSIFAQSLLAVLLLLIMSELLSSFSTDKSAEKFMLSVYKSAHPIGLFYFAILICAPLFEEMLFRGFLLKGFANSFLGNYGAIIITSALWASIHLQYDFFYMSVIFFTGIIFSYAKIRSQSILLPFCLHFIYNAIASLQIWLVSV
jgi:membrane protease YdiL (CAAX protease family)